MLMVRAVAYFLRVSSNCFLRCPVKLTPNLPRLLNILMDIIDVLSAQLSLYRTCAYSVLFWEQKNNIRTALGVGRRHGIVVTNTLRTSLFIHTSSYSHHSVLSRALLLAFLFLCLHESPLTWQTAVTVYNLYSAATKNQDYAHYSICDSTLRYQKCCLLVRSSWSSLSF